ncbi:MAG: heavy-metal-associated domain-containing protein [Chloroflexota bacterium]
METITLVTPDVSCEHCKRTIEREIGALDGIQGVDVDIDSKHVTVTYNATRIAKSDIVDKLDDEGYPVAG